MHEHYEIWYFNFFENIFSILVDELGEFQGHKAYESILCLPKMSYRYPIK